ncbi:MAG: CpsD/CapB family tyrosine-protein kinase [Candidatus Omnitrophica bacterium]|nr:CpsD/CapB family tyrosine-protein kinase [Candidatus Omnitrophota bacterium]
MGKITDALKKAAEERIDRFDKITKIREREKLIIKKIGDSNVDPRIVTYFDSKALITEQYKILRTNLLANQKKKPVKVLVVTSSLHSEGKTITVLNLSMVLAQSTQKPKVLVIDGDIRRGRISKYLGVPQKVGLTEVLTGKKKISDVLFNIDVDNLTFISSGSVPENPAELLASNKMKRLIEDMKVEFDHVLIDTPPIISVTDSGIVGAISDGVLMVIQAGRTQRGIIKRAEELLHQSHSKVVGHVLTNIEYHLPEYIYRYL